MYTDSRSGELGSRTGAPIMEKSEVECGWFSFGAEALCLESGAVEQVHENLLLYLVLVYHQWCRLGRRNWCIAKQSNTKPEYGVR